MGGIPVLGGVSVILAFSTTCFLVPALIMWWRRVRNESRMQGLALGRAGMGARLLRNGVPAFGPLARSAVRSKRLRSCLDDMAWFARSRGYASDAESLGSVLALFMILAGVGASLLGRSMLFGLMVAVCLAIVLTMVARHALEHRRESMREEVPDVLHAMSACFHAGYSLLQAFQHIAGEVSGPLGRLFRQAASDLETGRTASETLQQMRIDSSVPELTFVTAALEIQHQTGGSLQKIIDSACESIESELALRRSLRVQTAQARLSMRVITVMPFALIAVFSLISPGFLAPFFASPLGVGVFCFAIGMQVLGVMSVRKLLDVEGA